MPDPTTPPAPPAGTPPQDPPVKPPSPPDTVTLTKAEFDRLNGTLGDLQKKQQDREAAERAKEEEEAKNKGEYQKLLDQRDEENKRLSAAAAKYDAKVKREHEKRTANLDDVAKKRLKLDGTLTTADMERNLEELDRIEEIRESMKENKQEFTPAPPAAPPVYTAPTHQPRASKWGP